MFDPAPRIHALGFEEVAMELSISKAAAKRLMDTELFSWKPRRYGSCIVTREEVDAYKRKLAKTVKKSAPARLAA